MSKGLLVGASLLVCLGAQAQGREQPLSGLRGVELGSELDSAFRPCATSATAAPCTSPNDVMRQFGVHLPTLVERLPVVPGLGSVVAVDVLEGRVERVETLIDRAAFSMVLQTFSERHGVPKETGSAVVGRIANWSKDGATLQLRERAPGRDDVGLISLMSGKYWAQMVDRRTDQRRAIGSAL